MIKLQAVEKKPVEVEVSERELFQQLQGIIRFKYGLHREGYLREGKLYHEEHTSHAYEVEDGEATPEQIKAYGAIDVLHDVLLKDD